MGMIASFSWESNLIVWLQSKMGPGAATAASLTSLFGEELVVVAIIGFLYWCYDKDYGVFLGVNLVTAVTFNAMAKNLVFRRRPYFDYAEIRCLKPIDSKADLYDPRAQGYSFPSGHSTTAAVAYVSLARYRPRWWLRILAVFLPLIVGISRVCLGVHYPTDVFAGWALGLVVSFCIGALQKHMRPKKVLLILLAAEAPGWLFCHSNDFYSSYGLMAGFFFAVLFEERFVRFQNTHSIVRILFRLVGGLALFWAIDTVLKIPFSEQILSGDSHYAHLIRAGRYAFATFATMGVYPLVFRREDKRREVTPA